MMSVFGDITEMMLIVNSRNKMLTKTLGGSADASAAAIAAPPAGECPGCQLPEGRHQDDEGL